MFRLVLAFLLCGSAFAQSNLTNGDSQDGAISMPFQVQSWTFSANSGDSVSLSVGEISDDNGFWPSIRVQGPGGGLIAGSHGAVVAQVDLTAPSTGTYTVLISSDSGQGSGNLDRTGTYRVTLAKTPGAFIVADEGGPMTNGARHLGEITVGDLDMWSFEAHSGDALFLSIGELSDDNFFWPNIRLYGPNGVLVAASHGSVVAQIDASAPLTGTYTVLVSSNSGQGSGNLDGTGTYRLTLATVPGTFFVSLGDDGGSLTVGAGNFGSIDVGDVDMWRLNATAGQTVTLRIDDLSNDAVFWPWIRLRGPAGALVASSSGSASAQLSVAVPSTGIYTVLVSSNSGQGSGNLEGTGSYQITSSHAGIQETVPEPQLSGKLMGNPAPCPSQTSSNQTSSCLKSPPPAGCLTRPGCVSVANPIALGPGNKFQMVTDYETVGTNKLDFTRYYNSSISSGSATFASTLGLNWRGTYDRYVRIVSASSVLVERADGRTLSFTLNAGVWTTDSDVDLKLSQNGSGIGSTWTLIDPADTTETYSTISPSEAILTKVQARNGYAQDMHYDGSNHLASVTDSFSRVLQFGYSNNLLQTLTTPDSLTLTYGYDSSGGTATNDRLTSVAYSTSPHTSQTYLYENASFPFALTGIIDENGVRFAIWTYDSSGRPTSSEHAGGAELTQIVYNGDGSRTVTNALGQQETYDFTTLQGVPKVTQINRLATATTAAATRTFTYDANGYKASETDWNGNLTIYVNDAHGQPTSITEASSTPQARTTTITYDATFHLPTKIGEAGLTTDLTYDVSGNILTRALTDTTTATIPYSTNGAKRVWTYTWGANGLLASTKGPRSDVNQLTTFAYDGSGTLTGTTNALGQQTNVTLHTPGGLPQTITGSNNVTTQLTYDARLRLASSAINTAEGTRTTNFDYDAVGNLLKTTLPDGSALTSAYDAAHRLTSVKDLFNQATAYTLDGLGNRTQVDIKDVANVLTHTGSATFDAVGRLIQEIGGAGQLTKYFYDGNGNALTVTDPLNRVTTQAFDSLNRLFQVTDALGGIATTTFDTHDRPLSVTAPNGAVTTYVYDGFGDLIQTQSPDSGKTVYRYDPAGNLTQVVDARNIVQNHSYDALDRRVSTTYPGGPSENITLTYDQPGHGFGIGKLTSVIDEAGTLSRAYDERGNLTTETRVRGAVTLLTSYTYDPASRTASIVYPSGATAAYDRDIMGRVTAVTMKSQGAINALSVLSNIVYQPFGPLSALTFGNGVAGTRTFDLDYRLTNIADSGIENLTYGYNAANDVLSIADAVHAANSQSFGYDTLDRLTSATGVYGSQGFTYDSVGNRLTQTAGGVTTNYTYTPQSNRLIRTQAGGATQILSYTPAGNITTFANVPSTRPATGVAHSQAGRLMTVLSGGQQTLQYAYDAFGHRLAKVGASTGTTLFQYDQGNHLLEETDAAGVARVDYVYLRGQPIATLTPSSGQLAFLHTDRLGTPQIASNSSKAILWAANYEPFGAVNTASSQTGSLVQDLRFPGQEFEIETGWHQNGFRDYAPSFGRYLESDPIGLGGGLNAYAYAADNPSRNIDPRGTQMKADKGACSGEYYDTNDPNYHHYELDHVICTQSSFCTPDAVFNGLLRNAAPGQSDVSYTGSRVEVLFMGKSAGPITQVVDQSSLTVYNLTGSGHIFDPGYVARSVVVEKGFVMVRTIGEGTGSYPTFNKIIAGPAFTYQDLLVKQYVLTHDGPGH